MLEPEEMDCFLEGGREAGDIGRVEGPDAFFVLEVAVVRPPLLVCLVALVALAAGADFGFDAP
jgi:hypothetical protein